jgi:hypothetical protein
MSSNAGDYISNSLSPYSPVKRNPNITFLVAPPSGSAGVPTDVVLTWSSDLGVSASIDQGIGPVALSGNRTVFGVVATTTWTLSITKLDGAIVTQPVTYTAS